MKLRLFTPLVLLVFSLQLAAQESIVIKGTSSLHDWESVVEEYQVTGDLNLKSQKGTVAVSIKTNSIKSGKSIMDDKTYDALKAKKHPEINFRGKLISASGDKLTLTGDLTIAGVTKPATIESTYTTSGATLNAKGVYNLKMTDFGIDPPTAMFGTLTTGDDISIEFNVNLNL